LQRADRQIARETRRPDPAPAVGLNVSKERKAELVTGEPGFKPLEKEIKIHWLTVK
jgi:hypothetical protein